MTRREEVKKEFAHNFKDDDKKVLLVELWKAKRESVRLNTLEDYDSTICAAAKIGKWLSRVNRQVSVGTAEQDGQSELI